MEEKKKVEMTEEQFKEIQRKLRMARATRKALELLKERRKESSSKEAQNPNEVEGEGSEGGQDGGAGQVISQEQ